MENSKSQVKFRQNDLADLNIRSAGARSSKRVDVGFWVTAAMLFQSLKWCEIVNIVRISSHYYVTYSGRLVNHVISFNKFPAFFVQAFRIVVVSWKFTMLLIYILWDDKQIFMISALNEQLQQQLEYTLL